MARRAAYIFIGAVILAAAIATLLNRNPEPRYNGRTLEQWMKIYNQNQNNYGARDAISIMAPNSIPTLIRWLRRGTVLARMPAFVRDNDTIRNFIVRMTVRDHDLYAIQAFELAGTNAVGAVPALLELIANGTEWQADISVRVLSIIGPGGVPPIRQALTNRHWLVRRIAAERLASLGTNAAPAIPDLTTALSDPNSDVREMTTNALRVLAPELLPKSPPQ